MKKKIGYILLMGVIGLAACAPKSLTEQDPKIPNPPENTNAAPESTSIGLNPTKETTEPTETNGGSKTTPLVSLNTSMGELSIVSSKFVDEINGVKPAPDEKILLVSLAKDGVEISPGNFSLEEFQAMVYDTSKGEIYILGDDGSKTTSNMAGWVGTDNKEFAMGFKLPKSVSSYVLVWPENDPIELIPVN